MVGKLLVRGMLAGVIAAIFAFAFFKSYGEPWVDHAIAIEEQHSTAAGMAAEPELVSRSVQAGLGLLTGVLVYGVAIGGLFAIAYAFANKRLGVLSPRSTAMLIAIVGLVALIVVPALKYPANPPAVGSGDTIGARTQLYFLMVAASVLSATLSIMAATKLWPKIGGWYASLAAVCIYAGIVAVMMQILPAVNEVPEGFPAETLYNFRTSSLAGHVIFWTMLGVAFDIIRLWSDALWPKRGTNAA
ncbi:MULTISPECIES: CbtA family protein [Hyphomicrobiales]|uniref:CbtA family protein n=1 Tax=Hyphomicrobiales TaxID=356 RepID=UPI0011DF3805|nr:MULTISPECIES: CbtA family protein [Hyphomicrobiales]MCR5944141.1 CbtA family protein [Ochrobactrum sp. XJ1]MDG3580483.1 CbtA family protein [Rhizobium sp. YJ-22]UVV71059.1 CbtA family protein [Brucella anthropi]